MGRGRLIREVAGVDLVPLPDGAELVVRGDRIPVEGRQGLSRRVRRNVVGRLLRRIALSTPPSTEVQDIGEMAELRT